MIIRSSGRYLAACGCCLCWNCFLMPGIPALAGRYRVCRLPGVQPIQVDDGSFRLHRHVVKQRAVFFYGSEKQIINVLFQFTHMKGEEFRRSPSNFQRGATVSKTRKFWNGHRLHGLKLDYLKCYYHKLTVFM